jgi:hypothetical protein
MADSFYAAYDLLSKTLGLPASYFEGANFLFYVMLPYLSLVAFWYMVLTKLIKIIRNPGACFGLSFVMAFFSLPVVPILQPAIVVAMGPAAMSLFSDIPTILKFIFVFMIFFLVYYGYPYLLGMIMH